MRAPEAASALEQARAAQPSGDAFTRDLYAAQLGYADYEYSRMQDYTDTIYHARKAERAARGETVEPQPLGERVLPPGAVADLADGRARLVTALGAGARESHPSLAATAQASFDCWIEQQEENFQPNDIAACRKTFMAAMSDLETAMMAPEPAPTPVPDMVTIQGDVLFDFDKATIKPDFASELDGIAGLMLGDEAAEVLIVGHTDSVGSDDYNQGLSQRRAAAVRDYLVSKGVAAERMTVEGKGESEPIADNATKEGRAMNRRVVIHRR